MKNWLINLAAKIGGIGKLWDFLDGKKAYATGGMAVLGALVGLGSELAPLLAAHDTAGIVAFATHVNSDPAYLALLAGFGVIAAAHKANKIIDATKANAVAPAA